MGLNKRILRNIKSNFLRWFALLLLVLIGMFMVVSMVTSAEVVTQEIEKFTEKQNLEDGEFTVFVPLTDADMNTLKDKGIEAEEMFYIDFIAYNETGSTVRVFKNRKNIDLEFPVEGAEANHKNQIMIERHYASEHGLNVGDKFTIADIEFDITGLCVSPDYDNCKQNLSDVGTDHAAFGTAFVNDEAYSALKATHKYKNNEEYLYSFKLHGDIDNDQVKELLKDIEFDVDSIDDDYVKDIVEKLENEKNELKDGVSKISESGHDLNKGIAQLSDGIGKLSEGIDDMNAASGGGIQAVADSAEEINKGAKELYDYSTEFVEGLDTFKDELEEMVEEKFNFDIDNLTMFMTAEENPRIKASIEDVAQKKSSGTISGILVLILLTYVISVFIVNEISNDSAVIGTLYSMGVSKKRLILHYVSLPVIITFVGGILGTCLGFTSLGLDTMLKSVISYYSLPKLNYVYPGYMIVYGILMPPIIAFAVNGVVIGRKLSKPPLVLLRKQSVHKVKTIKLSSVKSSFVNRFRIRQFLLEMKAGFTIFFGMLVSLVFLFLGITCFCAVDNFQMQNKEDMTYKYMYSLKYELEDEDIPADGEKCYVETLNKEVLGYDMNVTLMGVERNSDHFGFKLPDKKNKVVMGSSAASKFGLKAGDTAIFRDKLSDRLYSLEIERVEQYSIGLYIFMDIDLMRSMYQRDDNYFNVLLSNEKIDIDPNMIYSVTKDSDILHFGETFKANMNSVIYMMLIVSIVMFVVVMYLMINIMLERSSNNIALMKIFGYTDKEVKKLYLDGNFLVILISAVVSIPLSKMLMNMIWPSMVANMQCGFDISLPIVMYPAVLAVIIICYFIVSVLLMRKIKRIVPADILKDRE